MNGRTILFGFAVVLGIGGIPASGLTVALAESPEPVETPRSLGPISTAIVPGISTVAPIERSILPETNIAQTEASQVAVDQSKGLPWTPIGIGAGVAAATVVLVLGSLFRVVRRGQHESLTRGR